jgi:hypothetical protein
MTIDDIPGCLAFAGCVLVAAGSLLVNWMIVKLLNLVSGVIG